MKNNKVIDIVAPAFTSLMIKKIESLKTDWHKPWISVEKGSPRNLSGRIYTGGNMLTLSFLTEIREYKAPIFLTFKQAEENGMAIRKGERSFPVYFWYKYALPKEIGSGEKGIPYEKYQQLSEEEQAHYRILFLLRYYSVFNIDQTDLEQKDPVRYAQLTDKTFNIKTDGFECAEIDTMVSRQGWLCPICLQESDSAFYSTSQDRIVCPLKEQFPKGTTFYSTLLHEIAHSTGHDTRLKRDMTGIFGSSSYAREELVAELTSALCSVVQGITAAPQEENAAYLDSWLDALKAKPDFLFDVLIDANKAATMILDRIEECNQPSGQNAA